MITGTMYADRDSYSPVYTPDVAYAHRQNGTLYLQILTPVPPNPSKAARILMTDRPVLKEDPKKALFSNHAPHSNPNRFPAVVDVPGSGWSGAEGYNHIPQMVDLARRGYVVACVGYRGTYKDDVRFPAAVQDVKEAVRFLRANADEFLVDTDRIALLGDSSGGNTVAMAALTGDEEEFATGDNLDQTSAVRSCIVYYGPTDLCRLVADRKAEGKHLRPGEDPWPFEGREIYQEDFLFSTDQAALLRQASPQYRIHPSPALPPFLFLQGDEDPIIPMAQGIRFCESLRQAGGRAEFYRILGGGHGTGCWTNEAMDLIASFLRATL